MHIDLVSVIVADYDEAIAFFTGALGFELTEDSPATTTDGRPKRWVVVRPPGEPAATGLLLAQADGERQTGAVGDQFAGRGDLSVASGDCDVHNGPPNNVTVWERYPSAAARRGVSVTLRGNLSEAS